MEGVEVVLVDNRGDNVLEDQVNLPGLLPKNVTDPNGRLAIEHVRPGAYSAHARQDSLQSERIDLTIEAGATAVVTLRFPASDS